MFTPNTDPKFQHVQPYDVTMPAGRGYLGGLIALSTANAKRTKGNSYTFLQFSLLAPRAPAGTLSAMRLLVFDMDVVRCNREPGAAGKNSKP